MGSLSVVLRLVVDGGVERVSVGAELANETRHLGEGRAVVAAEDVLAVFLHERGASRPRAHIRRARASPDRIRLQLMSLVCTSAP